MKDDKQTEQAFLDSITEQLDQSCDRLDGYTLSRLNRMKNEALAQPRNRLKNIFLPFSGLVTASVLVVMLMFWNNSAS